MQQVPFGITQAYKGDSPSQHSCKNPKATQASINPQYPFLFRHNLIATTFPSYPNLVIQVFVRHLLSSLVSSCLSFCLVFIPFPSHFQFFLYFSSPILYRLNLSSAHHPITKQLFYCIQSQTSICDVSPTIPG